MTAEPGRRRPTLPIYWKLVAAFVAISFVAPLLASTLAARLIVRGAVSDTHLRLTNTAAGIAAVLGAKGALVAGPNMTVLVDVAASASGAEIVVAGADATVLATGGARDVAAPAALTPLISATLAHGALAHRSTPGPTGQRTVVASAAVRDPSSRAVVGAVVAIRTLGEVRAATRLQRQLLWRSGLAGIALSVLLGLALARGITRPLQAMVVAAEAISRGDFDHRVPPGPDDEVGRLAAAFNRMVARLDQVLGARRELLAAVSHELRTPLTSIAGFVAALRDRVIGPDEADRAYAVIDEDIGRLRRLIGDLFELSKLEAGQARLAPRAVRAGELVEAAAERGRVLAGQDGPRIGVGPVTDEAVWADPDQIFAVLGNLVANALRFTPPQGAIDLSCRLDGRERVRFEVADTGSGIAPADIEHVFERFYTVDPSRSRPGAGTGLGLSLAQEVVRAHGGAIGVESQVGAGSRFWFVLPTTAPGPASSTGAAPHRRRPFLRGHRH